MNEFMDEKMLELFFEDTREMLESSMDEVIDLENGFDKAILDNIMRTMHSLKGGAAMIELEAIEKFSHKLEDVFIELQNQEREITTELVDVMVESLGVLKKWTDKRNDVFKDKPENFNLHIEEEEEEIKEMLIKVNVVCGEEEEKEKEEVKEIAKKDKKKETKLENKNNTEANFRIDIYLDETAPMFEIKRTIIMKTLGDLGEIIESIPSSNDILRDDINYYKVLYKTDLTQEELSNKLNIMDVYFVGITTQISELIDNFIDTDLYLKKNMRIDNINIAYENLMEVNKDGEIRSFNIGNNKIDIYGRQLIEIMRNEGGIEIGE